ncbi:hypothetical protein AA309_13395 [Microvirga vignae]|uniref:Peptidase M48 domain-containing protein n=1 Tax=Microvirga vignae TaxID=1225564 RepID=A0A0H1RBR7_9HYPH|nr:M48 family metallopeptidase [Microvirga vignae]KLK92670.1 hypothetical protein AA309_13395 [Microvirga vignae]
MQFNIRAVRHHKEENYGNITLIVGGVLWFLLLVSVLASDHPVLGLVMLIFYGLVIWCALAAARALLRAHMFGHYVMVGPQQFPHIQAMVEEGAKKIGLLEAPTAFVYNSHGVMNAIAIRLIGRHRYVWLSSAIIDADDDEQLRFVIGHELGHHVAGHLDDLMNLVRWPSNLVPFLGAAYSRARELTCDRVGAFIVQDLEVSRSALQMLACGSAKLNGQMNSAVFAEQEKLVPPIAGVILKIFSTYPRHTQRVEEVGNWLAVQNYAQSAAPVAAAA